MYELIIEFGQNYQKNYLLKILTYMLTTYKFQIQFIFK